MNFKRNVAKTFIFSLFLIFTGCGADNLNDISGKTTSRLDGMGKSCGCTSTYLPVCANGSPPITYDNECIARCFSKTEYVQGNCIPSERPVCVDGEINMSEIAAQAHIRSNRDSKITQYGSCGSAHY